MTSGSGRLVDELVQQEPPGASDPDLLGLLAAVGIVQGEPFEPDARMRKILEEAVEVGNATARTVTFSARPEEGFAFYPDSAWESALFVGGYEFLDPPPQITADGVRSAPRATAPASSIPAPTSSTWPPGITPAMCMRLTGIGSQYIYGLRDAKASSSKATTTTASIFPPDIPDSRFWSMIALRPPDPLDAPVRSTHAPRRQPIRHGRDEPGWLDRHLLRARGARGKEPNWLQTVPGKGWFDNSSPLQPAPAVLRQDLAAERDRADRRLISSEENLMPSGTEPEYGQSTAWQPERPRLRLFPLLVSWLATGVALMVAAALLPGVDIESFWGALLVAAIVAALNAVIPPVLAALRLPLTLVLGFLLVLIADAVILLVAADLNVTDGVLTVDNFGWALLASLVVAAVSVVLAVLLGSDEMSPIRIAQRIARRLGIIASTDVPGIVYLEIDGLALPVLRRAMRDGNAPNMARWVAEGTHRLAEWETDLSSQTGASQAGILLGSNEDISAFRWVEKETATMMTCSAPPDCAEIERRRGTGIGLLVDGGASRGNLLSGEAEDVILTVSRMEAEKKSNPGYRAFLANGDNVTRTLVLFGWEVVLEWTAALRAIRRDVHPRGHRGGIYPLIRAAMCVFVRDLIVSGVLTDMMRGRPAIYATFSGYDEVAHHSGLERADTLEALRKLDDHFAQIERACRYAPRPYEIVVLSDHGQTQGATFKQRNGYGLDELVERSLARGAVEGIAGGDEQSSMVGNAFSEATGTKTKRPKNDVSDRDVVVLGSGNLGLVYLMEERRRLTLEELEERHPELLPALRTHPHVGWLLVRSSEHGAVALGARGAHYLADGRVEGEDPLAHFSPTAPRHLLRTDGFEHVADIMVGSFYDPDLDEGCAFEELISFHGGIGGPQTRPFILHPAQLEIPPGPILGAASVHGILAGWRQQLQAGASAAAPAERTVVVGAAEQPVGHPG